jgi:hypothetical protein
MTCRQPQSSELTSDECCQPQRNRSGDCNTCVANTAQPGVHMQSCSLACFVTEENNLPYHIRTHHHCLPVCPALTLRTISMLGSLLPACSEGTNTSTRLQATHTHSREAGLDRGAAAPRQPTQTASRHNRQQRKQGGRHKGGCTWQLTLGATCPGRRAVTQRASGDEPHAGMTGMRRASSGCPR